MKNILRIAIGALGSFFLITVNAAGDETPVGYWKTIDDTTGKPKSIVRIWQANNELQGKVVKIFPKDGSLDQGKRCTACTGSNKNQPIVGMTVLSGLKSKESQWSGGEILDPENGKTYNVTMRVAANGKKLNVRGYIGIPLLGRSQTWERMDLM